MEFAAAALVSIAIFIGSGVAHGVKTLGQKIGHELKHEPPKLLHLIGIHRGHLQKDEQK